jgi:multiple sugar transport system permease protein
MVHSGSSIPKALQKVAVHLVLFSVAALMIIPFYWMVSTSLKFDQDVFRMPPQLFPDPLNLRNFPEVFDLMPMARAFFNSVKIALFGTLGTLFTSSLAAYAFAKVRFQFKSQLFILFLSTIMIPGQVTLIPLYILFSRIGWIDTHWPLIVPAVLLNAYGVFLLRQFMEGIPDSYVESAKIDGASHFQIYWRIVLPLCKPSIITLGLFSFIGHWNNFLGPLIFLSTDTKFTVPLIINSFRTVYYVEWGLLMAAATVAIVPVVVLYLLAQRYFVEGITLSGLKG